MKRLLYITHLSGRRLNRFWISTIKATQELGFEFHLACNMEEAEHPRWDDDCETYGVKTHQIDFCRNPVNTANLRAARQLMHLLNGESFEVVHCNTPVGGLVGRICAHKAKVPKVIYQAHGFHFWRGAPLRNWLLYYPVERCLARITDVLITINKEDYERAKHFPAKKTVYVPGVGIDTELFCSSTGKKGLLRKELGIPAEATVLLSVGELIRRKNHRIVIEAIKNLNNTWYVICGQGPLKDEYIRLAEKLGVDDRVILAGYRTDVMDFYGMADLFVLPSRQEGLSVALMEAMASGLPCIVSNIRGNTDLIEEAEYRFPPDSREGLVDTLSGVMADPDKMIEAGSKNRKAVEKYRTENVTAILKEVYER